MGSIDCCFLFITPVDHALNLAALATTKHMAQLAVPRSHAQDSQCSPVCSTSEERLKERFAVETIHDLYERFAPRSLLYNLSRQAIDEGDRIDNLIYGEVPVLALRFILQRAIDLLPRAFGVFWDLGSGSAHSLLATLLLQPSVREVHGVEIVEAIHDAATRAVAAFEHDVRPALPAEFRRGQRVCLHLGDCLRRSDAAADELAAADVVLFNSTCFQAAARLQVAARAGAACRSGTVLVLISHRVEHELWTLVESAERRMSWGPATVLFYRRV